MDVGMNEKYFQLCLFHEAHPDGTTSTIYEYLWKKADWIYERKAGFNPTRHEEAYQILFTDSRRHSCCLWRINFTSTQWSRWRLFSCCGDEGSPLLLFLTQVSFKRMTISLKQLQCIDLILSCEKSHPASLTNMHQKIPKSLVNYHSNGGTSSIVQVQWTACCEAAEINSLYELSFEQPLKTSP